MIGIAAIAAGVVVAWIAFRRTNVPRPIVPTNEIAEELRGLKIGQGNDGP